MTEYKRPGPGNKPTKVVLTAAVRADLKTRGFKESPAGTFMSRDIGEVHINIYENGNCNIHLPNRFHSITFAVDIYWAPSILYITQMELNKDAARIRQEAEVVTGYADAVMDVVCGKKA